MGGRRGLLRGALVIQSVNAHDGKVVVVCWSRGGGFLATSGQDGVVRVWGVAGSRGGLIAPHPLRELTGHTGDVLAMAWSKADFLATAAADRSVRLWHPQTEQCLRRFVHLDMVTAVAFHPEDDNCLATGGCDGVVRVWRPAAHACVALSSPAAAVSAVRFSADGDALLVGRYDGALVTYDARAFAAAAPGRLSPSMPCTPLPTAHAPNGPATPLVSLSQRVIAPARRRRRPGAAKVCAVASLASSADIVAVTADARAHVFGADTGHVVCKLRGATKRSPTGALQSSLSPDGRFLVASADGGDLNVIDFAYCRIAAHGIRRLVGDETLTLERIRVTGTCAVTAAEFAGEQAVSYALGEQCVKGAMVLAVGGDDGSLKIVNNVAAVVAGT